VIKSLIILVLLVLLCGGAYLSRPGQKDFEDYVRSQMTGTTENPIMRLIAGARLESFIESCTLKDRYLWVTVEQEGKTQFVGAFSTFWPVNQPKPATAGDPALPAVEPKPAAVPVENPPKDRPKDPAARWPN
jgi:hypothetical protein